MNTTEAAYRFRVAHVLLAVSILAALLLRLWGINHDLPYIYDPDEPVPLAISLDMLKTVDLHPHFFHWPSLLLYVNLLAYIPYFFLGKFLGVFHTPNDILAPIQLTMGVTYAPMPTVVMVGRLVSVSLGMGAVLLTYVIGRHLTQRMEGGLLATLLLAVSLPNVLHSRRIAPDTVAVFFVVAAVWASLMVLQRGRLKYYVIAAICVGLAASSKYNGLLVITSLLTAHFFRHGWKGLKERALYIALLLAIVSFALTTPFAVVDFAEFYDGLRFDSQHYATGHPGMEGETLRWYLDYLWRTTGPLFLIALFEIARGLVSKSKEIFVVSVFPITYFAFISQFVVRNDRTILPLIPFLFLLAASALVHWFDRASASKSRAIRNKSIILLSAVTVLSVVLMAYQTVGTTVRLTTLNSRETARVWIEDNLPPGSRVAIEPYTPFINPSRFSVQGFGPMIDQTPEWYIDQGFEYLVFGYAMYGRFFADPERYASEVSQYNAFFDRLDLVRTFTDGGYEVRIYRIP